MTTQHDDDVPDEPSIVGRVVAGKYVIEAPLGDGAMGAVYRARRTDDDAFVALKVLHADVAADPTYTARFKREAKAASRLDHPNSVRVVDAGEEPDGLLFLAMEYVEGRDLHRVIHEDWPLSDVDIADILAQALAAIGVAHEMGVVHRDLKPENLMILPAPPSEGGSRYLVKVCDFGIAKILEKGDGPPGESSVTDKLTVQGMLIGTPEYMSPEQARGEPPEPRSDLYSLGVILYQLLTGRTPFEGESMLAVVLQHITKVPPSPRTHYPDVHEGLEAVCMKALSKECADRHATAGEMRAAIAAVIDVPSMRAPVRVGERASPSKRSDDVTRADEAVTVIGTQPSSPPPADARARGAGRALFLVAIVCLVVGGAAGWYVTNGFGRGIVPASRDTVPPSEASPSAVPSVAATVASSADDPGTASEIAFPVEHPSVDPVSADEAIPSADAAPDVSAPDEASPTETAAASSEKEQVQPTSAPARQTPKARPGAVKKKRKHGRP